MENQRTRLSKMMLKNALLELLKEKPLEDISVLAICDRAQINRTTFYRHYGCQNDLFNEIVDDFVKGFQTHVKDGSQGEIMLEHAMEYMCREREKAVLIIDSMSDNIFTKVFFDDPFVSKLLDIAFEDCSSRKSREYIKTCFSYGTYAIVRSWLNDGCVETAKEIADIILSVYKRIK